MAREGIEGLLDVFVEGAFRRLLDRHKAEVMEMDLTLVQAQALRLIGDEPLSTGKLASALGISAPAVTQLTDRLARKNLIERRYVKSDRRAVIVALTKEGGSVIEVFRRSRTGLFADLLSQLGDKDRMDVIEALGKMAKVLQGSESVQILRRFEPARTGSGVPSSDRRTAIEPRRASNELGEVPVTMPAKRRMRIEWD